MAGLTKKPLQVYLNLDQERVLRALAEREHVSMAELIRRSIDRYLEALIRPEDEPTLGLIGLGHSGRADLAENHDLIIAEQASKANR